MTILGDRMQTMDEKQQDVTRFSPKIFDREPKLLEMNKSYRNTVEITKYARALSGDQELELPMRHGQGVTRQTFASKEALLDQVLIDVNLEKYETAAILTLTEEDALTVCQILKDRGENYHYIDHNTSAFEKGLTVTTFYLAKGLN